MIAMRAHLEARLGVALLEHALAISDEPDAADGAMESGSSWEVSRVAELATFIQRRLEPAESQVRSEALYTEEAEVCARAILALALWERSFATATFLSADATIQA